MAKPGLTTTTTLVTRGPPTPFWILRFTTFGVQSISASTAMPAWYSECTAIPCAVSGGIVVPQLPT